MGLAITGSDLLCCLGDGQELYKALQDGVCGASGLRWFDPAVVGIGHGYQLGGADGTGSAAAADRGPAQSEPWYGPTDWMVRCIVEAVRQAGLDARRTRTAVIAGTGLRELRALERWHTEGGELRLSDQHFGRRVREAVPGVQQVLTVSNACAASGYALGMAQDLLELGDADAVVVAGADGLTESMLAVMGRLGEPPQRVEPFDVDRVSVLLGEGAAAVVLRRAADAEPDRVQGVILGTGMTCDAYHETAPLQSGVLGAMREAYQRAGVGPEDIGLVVAHGTGTGLNDPTEAGALGEAFAGVATPPQITAIKGATGHTSGAAALMNVLVALRSMAEGVVPPVVGLRNPIPEAAGLNLVVGRPEPTTAKVAQVDAFGFGGVNAVTIVGAVR